VPKVQINRTPTPNNPPVALLEGELSVEMATPTRLWVGVPVALDPTGKKLLHDSTVLGSYVLKTGDTMSGNLNLSLPYPALILNKPASGTDNQIAGYTASVPRWVVCPGNAIPETGANAGSDFSIHRYNDAGVFVDWPFSITRATGAVMLNMDPTLPLQAATKQYVDVQIAAAPHVLKTGDTMTGDLTITDLDPAVVLDCTAVGSAALRGYKAGLQRWSIEVVNADPDIGGNVGSNFQITRYDDTGTIVDQPFTISRPDGRVYMNGDVSIIAATAATDCVIRVVDENDVDKGSLTWLRATDTIRLQSQTASGTPLQLLPTGVIELGAGMLTRLGTVGPYEIQAINFSWETGPALHAWIGNVDVGEISFVSDYRIKKDVQNLPTMWNTVKALRPIQYTQAAYAPTLQMRFPPDNIERWGFIAHELQETLIPSAATGVKDQENLIQSPNPWTVIATLTKALQEAMARIEALESFLVTR